MEAWNVRVELLNLLLPRDRRTYLCFHWWCKRILDGDYQDFGFCSFAGCRFFLFSIFLDLRKIRNHATKCNATGTSSDRYRTHFHDGIHFSFAPCLHRACRLPFTIFWCSRWSEGEKSRSILEWISFHLRLSDCGHFRIYDDGESSDGTSIFAITLKLMCRDTRKAFQGIFPVLVKIFISPSTTRCHLKLHSIWHQTLHRVIQINSSWL